MIKMDNSIPLHRTPLDVVLHVKGALELKGRIDCPAVTVEVKAPASSR